MAMILAFLIFGLSICSIICALICFTDKNRSDYFKYFSITCIGSTIWGLGFGFLLIQKTAEAALLCRRIGMIGLVVFLLFCPKFFLEVAKSPKWLKKIFSIYTVFGIILYPFLVMPERQTFYMSSFGMSYTFANDIWNILYYAYIVIYTLLDMVILTIMIKNAKYKRTKILNLSLWIFVLIMFLGSILDTLLPMFGVVAFPGSTFAQFLAIFVGFISLLYDKKNTLTLQTISNHIYHSIDLPIIVINNDNKIEFMSDSGYRFFNVDKSKLNILDVKDLFVLDFDVNFLVNNFNNKECVVKSNNAYCNITIEKVRDSFDDIIGYIFIVTDLTEKNKYINDLKDAKEVAENAREEAEIASKSKDNFLANMSHELRTPLNAIIGLNELIQNDENMDNINNYSNQIERASKNLLSMINELFDFSKIQIGKLDIIENEYSVIDLIKEVMSFYGDFIKEKGLIYEINIDNNVPSILMGDEKRIKQCIVNLLKNSIKYTDSGKININVKSNSVNKKCNLIIEVVDTGIGIKKEEIDNLFVSFKNLEETNNRQYEGIGIGLTIVKKLMVLMNGKFDISSDYGIGTKCVLSLPQEIVDESFSGGYVEKNSLANVCILNDNSIEINVLKKVLQKEYVSVDVVDQINVEFIKEKKYDYLFVNYNGNNLVNEIDNVVYLVEDDLKLDDKKTLNKPINKTELFKLFSNSDEVVDEVYCPSARILAVDDNKLNLVILKGFLKKTGASIDVCYSGAEALTLTEKNTYDIIFLDHMMPGMDGVETFKKIRTQNTPNSNLPIIVVTANAVDGAKDYYLEQGFNDYISKPVDVDYLNLCLLKFLDKDKIKKREE